MIPVTSDVKLDDKDRKLIDLLRHDGRLSYRQLAAKAELSVLTVMKRVKALEAGHVITGYHATVDAEKLGLDVHAIIEVKIAKGKLFEVERRVASEPAVYAVFDHTGQFDTTLLARFKGTRDLDRFLKRLQTFDFVERTETKLVLNTIKLGDERLW